MLKPNQIETIRESLTSKKRAGLVLSSVDNENNTIIVKFSRGSRIYFNYNGLTMLEVLQMWESIKPKTSRAEPIHYKDYDDYLDREYDDILERGKKEDYHTDILKNAIDYCRGNIGMQVFINEACVCVQAAVELLHDEKDDVIIEEDCDMLIFSKIKKL